MKILQEKSECCSAKIIRFGGKRRQCTECKRTWRVYPAKQGRKSLRKQDNYLKKVFCQGFTIKQLASRSNLSVDTAYKRFHKSLISEISKKRIVRVRGEKLILVIDALWNYFNGELWTLYCLSIKSAGSDKVIILDPVLRPGKENAITWNYIINKLPYSIKSRIVAMVSDGIRGIETIADNNDWIIQRCHFHLLSALQKRRGKRSSTPGRQIREEIYQIVRQALTEKSERKLSYFRKRLALLANDPQCPPAMRMIAREFFRRFYDYRSYLEYPELDLPKTTNVMESINSIIRKTARTVNTPLAWKNWAIATIRFKSKFTCK